MTASTFEKSALLTRFRDIGERLIEGLNTSDSSKSNRQKMAKSVNEGMAVERNEILREIDELDLDSDERLSQILLANYTSYVAMLEYRNTVWPYEYMAFSRRIGELWEPFCKLPFAYPKRELTLYSPDTFFNVRAKIEKQFKEFVSGLHLEKEDLSRLEREYSTVWGYVASGDVNLSLDLHFEQNGTRYAVDYKSGFSSNEKGNTNRLLMVGAIYQQLPEKYENLMFVRQEESKNNNYLQRLMASPYWQVYCAGEAYDKIEEFSGFDLSSWMKAHIDWQADISDAFRSHIVAKRLSDYLTW
ncbi:hypothetical protein ACUIAC_09070 [Dermabacteraceae bacterium P13138]